MMWIVPQRFTVAESRISLRLYWLQLSTLHSFEVEMSDQPENPFRPSIFSSFSSSYPPYHRILSIPSSSLFPLPSFRFGCRLQLHRMRGRRILLSSIAILIFIVSIVNIVIVPIEQPQRSTEVAIRPPTDAINVRRNSLDTDAVCKHGLSNSLLAFEADNGYGSVAREILPENDYPIIHNSCFFLPTTLDHVEQHKHLLQLYPHSYMVISEQGRTRIDSDTRTIHINGTDEYDLLWHKTKGLWDLVANQVDTTFHQCKWFFKVDSDSFLNLHVIEQMLSTYKTSQNHYVGWFNPGNLRGRNHLKWGPVKIAIGSFYGFTRSIMLHWEEWEQQDIYPWGLRYYKGEDTNVAMFLRDHGVCLDVASREAVTFGRQSGVWGGFENITAPVSNVMYTQCKERVRRLMHNECFAYGHKVPLQWMPLLAEVMASQASNKTHCGLISKQGSRIVNGTIYRRVLGYHDSNTFDPCLFIDDTEAGGGWVKI